MYNNNFTQQHYYSCLCFAIIVKTPTTHTHTHTYEADENTLRVRLKKQQKRKLYYFTVNNIVYSWNEKIMLKMNVNETAALVTSSLTAAEIIETEFIL